MPVKDRVALDTFTSEICRVDADRRIHAALLKVTQDAKALLENIEREGTTIGDVMIQVRKDVIAATDGRAVQR